VDLKSALQKPLSPTWENQLCHLVCKDKQRFFELIEIFYGNHSHLLQRSTLIILASNKLKPEWVDDQVPRMVNSLNKNLPTPLKRNILRILQYKAIPETLWGHAANQCFNYLESSNEPVAIKAFSMTVLYNLTMKLPDLARELRLLIEEQYNLGSAGFKARGRHVLRQLKKDGH